MEYRKILALLKPVIIKGIIWAVEFLERRIERFSEIVSFYTHTLPTYSDINAVLKRMGIRSFLQYVLTQKKSTNRRTFLPCNQEQYNKLMREHYPGEVASIISESSQILSGKFSMLGSPLVNMKRFFFSKPYQLDWCKDPTTLKRFPKIFFHLRFSRDFKRLQKNKADIKGPWELGRMQYLSTIGQAYWLTGERKYAKYFANVVADFIKQNPQGFGPQWACNMDVGLRVVSWIVGISYFQGAPELSAKWWWCFLKSLLEHGRHLCANLEYGSHNESLITSNHHVANVLGLYWLSLVFPHLDAGYVWRGVAITGLELDINEQIHADGGDFESSIPYHRLTVEMFLSAYAMSLQYNAPLSQNYQKKLLSALRFLQVTRQASGRQPQVGDVDNGRAHIFSRYGRWQQEHMDHLLVAGAKVLNCPSLLTGISDSEQVEAIYWQAIVKHPTTILPIQNREILVESGLAVLKNGDSYLLLSNSPVGTQGFGNHKHNDQLAIEWVVGEQPIFVDAGSYTYTRNPEMRNRFRGVRFHNTVMVDNTEQNHIVPEWLFRMESRGEGELTAVHQTDDVLGISGYHTAYEKLAHPLSHIRKVYLTKRNSLIVCDEFNTVMPHKYRWHFMLHPSVSKPSINKQNVVIPTDRGEICIYSSEFMAWQVEETWYSPGYGQIQRTYALIAEASGLITASYLACAFLNQNEIGDINSAIALVNNLGRAVNSPTNQITLSNSQ